jgi:hypothetical protein
LNTRSRTKEEEHRFNQMKIDAELESKSKNESISYTHAQFLKERENTLIHKYKVSHTLTIKSTGLGLTELVLRYICWKCLKDDKLKGSDVIILTGVRQELSNDLILRMKQYFEKFGIAFDTRNTTLHLNGVRIRAFPAEKMSRPSVDYQTYP